MVQGTKRRSEETIDLHAGQCSQPRLQALEGLVESKQPRDESLTDWPANSPEPNPIIHYWSILKANLYRWQTILLKKSFFGSHLDCFELRRA